MLRTMVYPVDSEPKLDNFPSLESLYELIGGFVEPIPLGNGLLLLCNEDRHELNLPPNPNVMFTPMLGNACIVRVNWQGEFEALTDEDVDEIFSGVLV